MKKILIPLIMIFSLGSMFALSLEEARQLALQNNPELLAVAESHKASRANLWKTYLTIAPTATISGSYSYFDETQTTAGSLNDYDASTRYQLTVNQPIFNGGKVWLGAAISKNAHNISQESYRSKKLSTLLNLETRYFSVLRNKRLLEITAKNLNNSRANTEIARTKYELGTLSKSAYLQFLSEEANNEVNLIRSETMYQNSLLELANFLQMETIGNLQEIEKEQYRPELEKLQNLDQAAMNLLVEEVLKFGIQQNPSLKISEYNLKSSEKSLWMAGGNFLPSLNLQYLKSWSKYDFEDDFNGGSGQLGINVSLPIFPLADNGLQVAVSRHKLRQAKYNLESARDNTTLALRSSVLNLIAAARTVTASELALEYAAETYEQMKERFAFGDITANELLSVEIMFASAQNQEAAGFYDYLTAKSSLLQLLGTDDAEVLNELILKN